MSKKENRERNVQINFRVNEEELKIINKCMELANYKDRNAFIRKCINDSKIFKVDTEKLEKEINKLSEQISKIGTNINQIVRKINQEDTVKKEDLKLIISYMNELKKLNERKRKDVNDVFKLMIGDNENGSDENS